MGDLRPLYLAWLAGSGMRERDEHAFDYDEGDESEPQVPAGLDNLTAPQRALADFLRLDPDLLADEFTQQFTRLRKQHQRKPSLVARFDRAGLGAALIT